MQSEEDLPLMHSFDLRNTSTIQQRTSERSSTIVLQQKCRFFAIIPIRPLFFQFQPEK